MPTPIQLPGDALFDLLNISGDDRLDAEEIYAVHSWLLAQQYFSSLIDTNKVTLAQLLDLLEAGISAYDEAEMAVDNPAGVSLIPILHDSSIDQKVQYCILGCLKDYKDAIPYIRNYFKMQLQKLRTDAPSPKALGAAREFAMDAFEQARLLSKDFARLEFYDGQRGISQAEVVWAQIFHRFGHSVPSCYQRPLLDASRQAKAAQDATVFKTRIAADIRDPVLVTHLQRAFDLLAQGPTGALLMGTLLQQTHGRGIAFAILTEKDIVRFGGSPVVAAFDESTFSIKVHPQHFGGMDRGVIDALSAVMGHELFHAILSNTDGIDQRSKTVTEEEMAANIGWLIAAESGVDIVLLGASQAFSDAGRWQAIWNAYSPAYYARTISLHAVKGREASLAVSFWHNYIEEQTSSLLAACHP